MDEFYVCIAKWKNPLWRAYTVRPIYTTFWKRQNYTDGNQFMGWGWGRSIPCNSLLTHTTMRLSKPRDFFSSPKNKVGHPVGVRVSVIGVGKTACTPHVHLWGLRNTSHSSQRLLIPCRMWKWELISGPSSLVSDGHQDSACLTSAPGILMSETCESMADKIRTSS